MHKIQFNLIPRVGHKVKAILLSLTKNIVDSIKKMQKYDVSFCRTVNGSYLIMDSLLNNN